MMLRRRLLIAGAGALCAPAVVRAQSVLQHRFPEHWRPYQVPRFRVHINREHPLARDLITMVVPGSPHAWNDIGARTPPLAPRTNGGLVGSRGGPASRSDGANPTGALSSAEPVALEITTGLTLGWYGWYGTAHGGNDTPIFGTTRSTGSLYLANIGTAAGATNDIRALYGNGGSFVAATASANMPLNQVNAIAASFPMGGATGQFTLNGALIGSFTNSGTPTYDTTTRLGMGANNFDATRIPNTRDLAGAVWGRVLSNDELLWFTREPFAMLAPQSLDDRALIGVVGGGGYMMMQSGAR